MGDSFGFNVVWLTSKLFRNGDLAILLHKWVLAFSWKFCLDKPLYTHLLPEFLSHFQKQQEDQP
jgi:hypothetical protein